MTGSRGQRRIWGLVAAGAVVQMLATFAARAGLIDGDVAAWAPVLVGWGLVILLAVLASRVAGRLSLQLTAASAAREADRAWIDELQVRNAILQTVAASTDVTHTLKALAERIELLVPCDRVTLALATEDGRRFESFSARVGGEERRSKLRAEVEFPTRGTLIGEVALGREARIFTNLQELAADALDANLLHSSGFRSLLIVPLVARKRVVGTLNLASRRADAYAPPHVALLQPIAEILAVAYVAQQLQVSLTRLRTTEAMAELTLSAANEINGALQTIIGHCDVLERQYPDPALQHDLATLVRQAQRISELLERMRSAAHDRLRQFSAATTDLDEDALHPEAVEIDPDERRR